MNNYQLVNHIHEKYIIPKKWNELVEYLELKLLTDSDFQHKEILEIYQKACYIYFDDPTHFIDFLYKNYQEHDWLRIELITYAVMNGKSDIIHEIYPIFMQSQIPPILQTPNASLLNNFLGWVWHYRKLHFTDPEKWLYLDLAPIFFVTISFFLRHEKTQPFVITYFKQDNLYQHAYEKMLNINETGVIKKDSLYELEEYLQKIAEHRQYWQSHEYDNKDAWIRTLSIFKKINEYQELHDFFANSLAKKNIDIKKSIILTISYEKNIGENFMIMQHIVTWAQYHNILLIAAVPEKHYGWVSTYFGQYCADVMVYNDRLPSFLGFIPIAPGNITAMNVINVGYAGRYIHKDNMQFNEFKVMTRSYHLDPIIPQIDTHKDIKALFKKYKLKANNVILLSLTSVSQQGDVFSYEQLHDFWVDLVKALQQHDFQIVINAPKSDIRDYRHLKDTLCLDIPLEQLIGFVNHAGYFIGERSGLCEMLSISHAKRYFIDLKDYIEYPEFAGFKAIHVSKRDYRQNINWLIGDII